MRAASLPIFLLKGRLGYLNRLWGRTFPRGKGKSQPVITCIKSMSTYKKERFPVKDEYQNL